VCSIACVLVFTDRARDALVTFHAAAARWNPDVQLRLTRSGVELRPELVDAPQPGDEHHAIGDLTIFAEPGIDGTVDAGEHNVLTVVRP
jgi:hypothetical protein